MSLLEVAVRGVLVGGGSTGHDLTGVSALALSSLIATLCTFLGAWLGNHMRWVRCVDL
jgi:hypothetical protein